jgi:hypothetical protein
LQIPRLQIPDRRDTRALALAWLLRLAGAFTATAFLAMFLPVDWMAAVHRAIGLGELPRAPVVDYLARSVAAFYGFHGVLLLLVSTDVVRYRPLVWYVAVLNVVFGVILLVIDLHAGMPLVWTLFEGPSIIVFGVIVGLLNRSVTGIP